MDILRVAGTSLNQTPLDWEGNLERIATKIKQARKQSVEVLCFPELSLTGYGLEDLFMSTAVLKKTEEMVTHLLPLTKGIFVVLGMPLYLGGHIYNGALAISDGKVVGFNPKKMLAREGVHYEPRWFSAWPQNAYSQTKICAADVLVGDIVYDINGVKVVIEICEEAWSSTPPSYKYADTADLVLNLSASHFILDKYKTRKQLVANSSRAVRAYYLYANLLGLESGRVIYDGSVLLAHAGKIIYEGRRFGFDDGCLSVVDIKVDLARLEKVRTRSFIEEVTPDNSKVVKCKIQNEKKRSPILNDFANVDINWDSNTEFLEIQMLALFDYLRKSKAQAYMLSLSGGVDSSTVAVLVAQMVASAIFDLGIEEFKNRLGHLRFNGLNTADYIKNILNCVYQKTAQSGDVTENAARELSLELNAQFEKIDIDPMVNGYIHAAEKVVGRDLDWKQDDLVLQNIQARTRSPMIWMLANLKGAVLLATSNRSEIAVGYATMDGDTSGGLSPIAGIDKPFLRQWLVWAEKHCSRGLGVVSALRLVNEQKPTAELRPKAMEQTDESDLMPYEVLTSIEGYYLGDKMSPDDVFLNLTRDYQSIASSDLKKYVSLFLTKWQQNQWKRERMAPGFYIDQINLDSKSWCRYPILSKPWLMDS